MRRFGLWMACLTMAWLLVGQQARAADAPLIEAIEVAGNHFVEKETVLASIETRAGQRLDRRRLARDVRALYKTGFFSDIRIEGLRRDDRVRLVFHVKEYPLIREFDIEGNDEVKTKDLMLRLKLKSGMMFSPAALRRDIGVIRKGYLKKGYYQVRIEPKVRRLKDNRVDVTLVVREGDVTRLDRIRFAGNHAFSDSELRDALASKTSGLATWFTDRDVFDKRRFEADVQMLRQFYMNRGYLDMRVESSSVVISPDRSHFSMLYSLREGVPYHVGKIILRGDVVPDEKTLREKLELEGGDLFSMEKLRRSIDAITERVGDEGYAFATVTPEFKRSPDERKVDIALDIEKGREVYIERIEVVGNEKSVDNVVRRELKQAEGARYSSSKVRRSKQALGRTGLFKDTQISLPRGSAPDKVRMKVKVTEEKSGKFTFGVGYSQLEKVFIRASMSENNLFGRGYRANVSADLGKVTKNYNISLTDPYFMGENLGVTVNAFNTSSNQFNAATTNTLAYSSKSSGGGLSLNIPLTDELSWSVGWQYTTTTINNVPAGSSILLQSQAGRQSTGELTQRLIWDSTDSALTPREGAKASLSLGYAGLGGTNRFGTLGMDASYYASFGEKRDFTISPSMEFRVIRGVRGRQVPLYRRYSLGGIGSLRGFDSLGVSMRDPATQEALGGDRMLRFSLNGFFPIPYMRTAGFRGVLFADAGTVWGKVNATVGNQTFNLSERFSLSKMRASVGFGIEWLSPVGPITLSWGFPVRKQPGDVLRRFEFGLGMGF